jgi:hypothetical protein
MMVIRYYKTLQDNINHYNRRSVVNKRSWNRLNSRMETRVVDVIERAVIM